MSKAFPSLDFRAVAMTANQNEMHSRNDSCYTIITVKLRMLLHDSLTMRFAMPASMCAPRESPSLTTPETEEAALRSPSPFTMIEHTASKLDPLHVELSKPNVSPVQCCEERLKPYCVHSFGALLKPSQPSLVLSAS